MFSLSSRITLLPALLVLAVAPSCISSKSLMQQVPTATITNRLPPLELVADQGPLVMNDGALPEDPLRILQREARTNLMEPKDTALFGYAKLVVTKVKTKRTGRSLQAFQFVTFMIPAVFGMPLEWYETKLDAEVQILDGNGTLLGAYEGTGTSSVRVAMYSGYSQSDAPRLADVIALRGALDQIRPQLDTAATRLRPMLLAAGPMEPIYSSATADTGR